ncbi:MAG: helix-turn-helix transcriptional regulator [Clostridia bacterium]|nr:helix-turn-helix transcriptional regulator [Clostridia bacterium]
MKYLKPIEQKLHLDKMSLKNRLWVLQILLVFLLLSGIYFVLSTTGIIASFNDNSYMLVKKQLDISAKELSQRYSSISANTIELAGKLNKSIEKSLSEHGLSISDLKSHPYLLETLLGNEVEKAVFTMQKTCVSGVFVFFDATVNPTLSHALDSKAGFYIVDMDPDVMPYSSDALFLHYGPPAVARENDFYLHTEWELEYDAGIQREKNSTSFYNIPFAAAFRSKGTRLQDLGYWSPFFKTTENSEPAMTFSVPLIDKNGVPYGVCGLQISKTFFEKLLSQPLLPSFKHKVLLFSLSDSDRINMKNAVLIEENPGWLQGSKHDYLLSSYTKNNKNGFKRYYFDSSNQKNILGLDTKVSLYPSKSVFKDEYWVLAVLLPQEDVKGNSQLFLLFAAFLILFILGILISYFTSRYYVKPIVNTLNKIKEYGLPSKKTNIPEIDDFIEFLKKYPYESGHNIKTSVKMNCDNNPIIAPETSFELDNTQFEEFTQRLSTLSKAEREVFDLYIKGHTAKEISQILFISINTVKTHNKRIYAKMNVSSRIELLTYCYKLMGENPQQDNQRYSITDKG